MKILNKLKKFKKLHFVMKAVKHINNEEYVDFFLKRETNPLMLEFKTNGNQNRDTKFYVINEVGKGCGFFAEMRSVLGGLAFADLFGFVPIISWGKEFLYYEKNGMKETKNAFEYFFKQPTMYTIDDVREANLVTEAKLTQGAWIEKRYNNGMDLSEEYEKEISRIYKKYIRFNDDILEKLNAESNSLLAGKKSLGVHFRGTDFKLNYDNHPVSVKIEQEYEAIDKAMKMWGGQIEQIFLATDEINAVKAFKERYGEKIVWYEDVFRGDTEVSVAFSTSDRESHKYKLAYEVLRDMYTLSLCEGLVAGVSQVSICARIAKRARDEKYNFIEIIDNGKNYNNRKFTK